MFKKKSAILMLAALGLASSLTSCNLNDGEQTNSQEYLLCNLYIPTDGSDAFASPDIRYNLNFDLKAGNVVVKTSGMKIGEAGYDFTTDPMKYQVYVNEGQTQSITAFSGAGKTDSGTPVLNFQGRQSSVVYYVDTYVPGIAIATMLPSGNIMQYDIDAKYKVKTFSKNMFFAGETVSQYPYKGENKQFTTDKPVYAVFMNKDLTKAKMVIYKAWFAQEMPQITAIVLDGLDVTYSKNGFQINGENIVPQTVDGDQLTPNRRFTFDYFRLSTSNAALTKVHVEYKVAGTFNGRFDGSYVEGIQF